MDPCDPDTPFHMPVQRWHGAHDSDDLAGREAARDGGSIAAPPPRIGASSEPAEFASAVAVAHFGLNGLRAGRSSRRLEGSPGIFRK